MSSGLGAGLRDLVSSVMNDVLDDIPATAVFKSLTSTGAYDPVTDTYASAVYANVTVKVVRTRFRSRDIDGQRIKATDEKLIVAAKDLGAVVPKPDSDRVTLDGVDWEVKDVMSDPVRATYTLQVRRS